METQETENKKLSPSDFHTLSQQEEGAKLHLKTPDGEESQAWLMVVGFDSKRAKRAYAKYNNKKMRLLGSGKAKKEPVQADEERRKLETEFIAGLVIGWSFDEPFSTEAVITLLQQAPQLEEQINTFGGNLKNFLDQPSGD